MLLIFSMLMKRFYRLICFFSSRPLRRKKIKSAVQSAKHIHPFVVESEYSDKAEGMCFFIICSPWYFSFVILIEIVVLLWVLLIFGRAWGCNFLDHCFGGAIIVVFAKLAWPLFVPIEGGFYDLFALSPTFFGTTPLSSRELYVMEHGILFTFH